MNPGDIFLNMNENGNYDKYADGTLRVYLCKAPHERVQDAYYVERVGKNLRGEIMYLGAGKPKIVRDAMLVRWPEVLE